MVENAEIKLNGLRVLLVEDSFLAAASIAHMLEDMGCQVVGPFGNVTDAMGIVDAGGCDAGVLDVNLGDETSERLAAGLLSRGVPFFFVTGYMSPALSNPKYASYRRVHKPLTEVVLADALTASMRKRS